MDRRFSEMSEYELKQELARIREQANRAEQAGMVNEFAVLERKAIMAEAYLLNPDDFEKGEKYLIRNDETVPFVISYMNGVFAWGKRGSDPELKAYPISLLIPAASKGR